MKSARPLRMLVLISVCGAGLFLTADFARQQAFKENSENNMRQLALGLLNYEAAHRVFPPARMADHSWRIRLVPFLISSAHYANYDFSRPWDSSENLLIDRRAIPIGMGPIS